jgi:hypothetical protein
VAIPEKVGRSVISSNVAIKTFNKLWWRWMPGVTIVIPWPPITTFTDPHGTHRHTDDPNYYYRPWLEEYAGRKGWDWDWRAVWQRDVFRAYNTPYQLDDAVEIKFRKGKESIAVLAKLQWL